MNRLLTLLSILALVGCSFTVREDRAVSTMTAQGWTQVEVERSHRISPHWMGGCGKDDDVAFDIVGLNPASQSSQATVCCGAWPKGCTIRH